MIKYLFAFVILLFSLASFSQDTIELSKRKPDGTDFFGLGVNYLNKGEYKKADSLFTRSFEAGDRTIDTYFDRALTRKQLGNSYGFCLDMLFAAELGDAEANSLFWQNCAGSDSVLTCMKNMRAVIKDTVATMTNFDSVSNTKRVSVVQRTNGLSHRYFINANGKIDTFKLNDPGYDLMSSTVYDLMGLAERPEFPGGDKGLFDFLVKNIQYPHDERDRGIQGKVYITFVIDRDGSITNVDIYKGVQGGAGLSTEAMRVIKLLPKWKPGMKNGVSVRVRYIIPVYFSLH